MYGSNDADQNGSKAGLMLQKQAPASTIPRFNPHGYQPPPQERKKEDATSPSKRFMSPVKKRAEADEIVDFSKFNIEDLLLDMQVEFRNPAKAVGGWLPLEAYDNKELDTRSPTDWITVRRNRKPAPKGEAPSETEAPVAPKKIEISAQGLWRDKDGLCFWRKLKIQRYLLTSERYEGYWENTKEKCRLHRIYILFDDEDPRAFAKRFKAAYDARCKADSLLKYNFYVENMPTHQIPEIDNNEVNRILGMTQNTKQLRGKSSSDTTTLLSEVNFEFAKTMNKIVFDKHLKATGPSLITGPLDMPEEKKKEEAPYYGMIAIPPHNFPEQFSNFCFNSILNKDQSIRAMQDIRKECNDVLMKDIYNPNITKSMKVDEFKQIQKSSTSQISYYLKETWVNKIKDIIKTQFAEDPLQTQLMGRPWYSLNETSKESYEMGKLKKFLQQTKYVMQDTLQYMTEVSVKRFVAAICDFVPIKCEVQDSFNVTNTFYTEEQIKEMGAPKEKIPLFNIDLTVGEDKKPRYSQSAKEVVSLILTIFDNGIKSLQEITQVEQKLLPHLFKSNQKMFLKSVVKPDFRPTEPNPDDPRELPDENTWVFDEYDKLRTVVTNIIEPLDQYILTYDRFENEYKFDPDAEMAKYANEDDWPDVAELKASILFHQAEEKRIQNEIPEEIVCSVFKISTKVIRDMLAAKHKKIAQEQVLLIAKIAKSKSNGILEQFEKRNISVEAIPKGIEELSQIKDIMLGAPKDLEKEQKNIKDCMEIYHTLDQFHHKFEDEEEYDKMWRVFGAPQETIHRIEKQQGFLDKEKEKFIKQMENHKKDFNNQIAELENETSSFKKYIDGEAYEEVAAIAKNIKQRIDEAVDYGKTINNRENLIGPGTYEEVTDYTSLEQMKKDFSPFYQLWITVEEWRKNHHSWIYDPFDEIQPQSVEDISDNANKVMSQVIRAFRDKELPEILKIAENIKNSVEEFKPQVPIVVALRTQGMKERHWEMLTQKVGFEIKPYEGFTFGKCMEMNLLEHTEVIVDVGEKSGKEYQIETSMEKMKEDWKPLNFGLKDFKKTGTCTVTGFDDAMMMLDEHIVLTQTMLFSPFKKPFEAEIEEWNAKLLYVSDCIDEWMKVQGQWMYLSPIFDSQDIVRQLPSESKKFKNVDRVWKATITATKENPNALEACSKEGLKEKFEDANKNLDHVQRGLRDYLESKRAVFARFYFLSNDDLLEILSQTKEVENVRPHLRKVFENLMDVTFQPDKTITAMFSGEKECIQFFGPVDPKDKGVEFWMGELEQMMYDTIRHVLKKSVDHYVEVDRNDWILEHCGQCVLNGSQVHWTSEVEDAFAKGELPEYCKTLETQLLKTVELVRQKLTKLQSITMGALITIDVHAKDVIKNLVKDGINSVASFEWISQLRYYWEKNDCYVKCVQTSFPYGYEYLGNTFRLVITPLTDKCYMTLMGALNLNLGGAPAGPAGTGKTETTKDLAKALSKQCVVFNCSDGMDFIMIGKFFKGLAASGAWACFDEFNRINIEVLSVVASQLQQLFAAKANGDEEILFEESQIKMKPTFCAFITMNPGYAGRSELPDNLKALFRPVAMMVPDYSLIAEISLYSFGYSEARVLSKKMTTTFTLNSEQLSFQFHYDYGMRAVKSVINAAGLLKRADPDMNESQLVLRALRDVNLPKFLKDDIPLFENIIMDLFPGVEKPQINYGALLDQMKSSCVDLNLQPVQPFLDKIIQLYDTIQVRHGLMIVGPTGGGKSMNYKTLAHSMTAIKHLENFEKVNYHIINPKSILQGQLYGDFDPQTTEWQDGILAKIIQDCAKDESLEKHWVMFDGPVDAIWIENMNTVLDDNKKLCLNSGQIITLTAQMTMMFEVDDLSYASPATVSRCGMVYMEPGALGNEPLVKSWMNTLPASFKLRKNLIPTIKGLFDQYLHDLIKYTRKYCPEPDVTCDNNLVESCFRILNCYFADYIESDVRKVTADDVEDLEGSIEQLFIFALIWSIGGSCGLEGREKFDKKLRPLLSDKCGMPAEGTVYDYVWIANKKEWTKWTEIVDEYFVDNKLAYGEIVVPTFDSIRMQYIKKLLLMNKYHVQCPGPTGTGKTVNIQIMLTTMLPEEYQYIPITFSAQTSANQTQEALDEKFEKRRKGVYGPPTGKRFVIFVDDLNMPKKETYGAQPPIEILRQWMDHKGWYDRTQKEKPFMKIEDIIFITAMGPPGGGRSMISHRMKRHFNCLAYPDLAKESIVMIFKKILGAFVAHYSSEISNIIDQIVDSSHCVYMAVADQLKPTPSKSHYTFNLRDISKIIQGVCSADQKTTTAPVALTRIWFHENQRVFGDRMTKPDKQVLIDVLLVECEKLKLKKDDIFNVERILYGDYIAGIDGDNRPYLQIEDLTLLLNKINEYLEDFNSGSKMQMKLVMFLDACDHVNRICRILRQPMGNALLLGVGGSGRQSLTKLSTFMSNFKLYSIEVVKGYNMTNWRDNLKFCLMQGGVSGLVTTFLFVDTQIINEQMLEDINNVLNSGDVPQLYKSEDLEGIFAVGKSECQKKNLTVNKMNMFGQYLNRVKANLHVVLAMSPLGDLFRTRLLKFPSLVNCCTIDQFTNWPEEALLNVGNGSIMDGTIELGEDKDGCVEMFKVIHQSVEKMADKFLDELRRQIYVTPTSFLELLSTYKKVYQERKKKVGEARMRLAKGLDVLAGAAVEVAKLQQKLKDNAPILEQTQKDVEATKITIAKENSEAQEIKKVVSAEEAEASVKAAEVKEIKDAADADLAVALPALEEAVKKVKQIDVNNFYELKNVGAPSMSIVKMFEVCCYMFKLPKPKKPTDDKGKEKDPDGYFDQSKKQLLNNPKKFLQDMIDYDKDNIPDTLIAKVKPMMEIEVLQEAKIKSASVALVAVRLWVNAMITYHEVLKVVGPKRIIVAEMTAKLDVVMKALNEKRAIVKAINEKLDKLDKEQKALEAQAKALEDEVEDCNKKLVRAEKMIGGLAGEKERWTRIVAELTIQQEYVVGDSLVASGSISYCGGFTAIYREMLEKEWREAIKENNIKATDNITMSKVLGEEVVIRMWGIAGLPSDKLSVENGIIMFKSRRWPLMIDPQTQANKFIKNLGKDVETGLDVFKQSEANLLRSLELAIQFGKWVLLENIGEQLDPALEPILLQQKVKQGSGYVIKIGDKSVSYNETFKFFLTTTLPNPHYSPETQVKVSILNFAITQFGLEEQMLNQLIKIEFPDLAQQKDEIVESNAKNAKITYDLENKILHTLSAAKEIMDLLADDVLIDILDESAAVSKEIAEQKAISEVAEKQIDETREKFRNVAFRASILFFCIVDLSEIDPMYQYSLQWFQRLFAGGVKNSEKGDDDEGRIANLKNYFTLSLYQNVCRSLFEAHKLLFSFLLCVKILFGNNEIDISEWRFFLAGASGTIEQKPNPTDWLDDIEWTQVYEQLYCMNQLEAFRGIDSYFIEFHKKFKKIFDSNAPHEEKMPGEWNDRLNSFQKMILLKAIRADKITLAIQNFIIEKTGKAFVDPPTFNLGACYADSSNISPLIFVLSAGSDPVADFRKYAAENDMTAKVDLVSLGQGQAPKAEKAIERARTTGGWALLQNCHLSVSWMPKLEAIVENLTESNHPDFRIWLTSMPSGAFPVSVLQTSVKMTMEPPTGLRSNLMRSYANLDNRELNDCSKPKEFKALLFAFAFFHAIVQDRRKFGAIGWNIPYAFMNEEFYVCKIQLKSFLDNYEEIPIKVLNFLGAQVNYGGRVTDDKDIRLITCILERFINEDTVNVGFSYSDSGIYKTIEPGTQDDYIKYIDSLPLVPAPEAFGLHENAEITTNQENTRLILAHVLSVQPRTSSGGGKSQEEVIGEISKSIEDQTPHWFDMDTVMEKYPTLYNESMNTVLAQEVIRYNKLLKIMAKYLKDVQKALKGEVVMSEELDKMAISLFNNQVPAIFSGVGPLSLKPLSSWIVDLNQRIDFISKWINDGMPPAFWLSGFFFPQAFFTGARQNFARKHMIAIDELEMDFKIYDEIDPQEVAEKPEDGVFCYGMYLEGARWNKTIHMIDESKPKQLYVELPLIWYVPKRNREKPTSGIYDLPVYKVLSRTGTLSTTGHSTNFVQYIELPTKEDPKKWVRGGVAAFLALRY